MHFHPSVGLPFHLSCLDFSFSLEPPTDRRALDYTDDAANSSAAVFANLEVLDPYEAMGQEYPSYDLGKNSNLCIGYLHTQM